MWGFGRQPRNLAELLADLTRRDRGGDLETRSGSSKSSASNAIIRVVNRKQRRAPQARAVGAAIQPAAPIAVPGGIFNPIPGLPAVPVPSAPLNAIPGFKTIPPDGFPAAPTAPLLPLPRPAPAQTVTSESSRRPVATSQPPRPPVAPSPPPRQPAAPSSQPPRQAEPTRPPVMAPARPTPPPTENVPVTSQIPFNTILPTSDGPAAPAETDGAVASPGREASMDGRSANNGSRQIAILAGSIVGAMLLAGLVAMLCIRKNKKARKAREAHVSALPKHSKAGSISGSISYPVQQQGNTGPWAPPLRKPSNATSRGGPTAAAAWPMGQSTNRNSMEDGSLDDKQYLAYQNLVGNADNQITPPPAAAAQDRASRTPGSRDTRYLSASSADPYEQINGRYSEWPPMPPVPNSDSGGNAQNQGTVPIGYAQTTALPPPQQQQQQQQPRTMDQFSQTARINQHYSAVERQMLSPSYHQPGAQRDSVAPPSPLFFRLDNQGNLGPESRR
ncbi:hypothetical protein MCOR27_003677 [Pyricularia oryzae]|uniref:Uncharacterized protein n=1 Tax=Pyricularia grisea TaxID=148305 RepID=A0ABQ8NXY0_PYRGI|nr:hypothetical protein MCOR02_006719 [Pyricularia oryzae]KAI6303701.1 hypothetical protein MCOR33_001224 [Pyricularia grisea]KAI6255021.1 hypothetical protein MCOR19_008460 [Pyricularia oryzae]KAI6266034.1 hypothetical protein MCOR26_010403 [Pyricularia oryzae]KAI6282630.1 hypothetical protein MCOR27_003677 [Pyricularia oryzae]